MTADTMPIPLEIGRSVGPLPSPKELAEYEQIVPGAGEKLLHLMEEQQRHRIEVDKMVLADQRRVARLGQAAAFTMSFLALALGVSLAFKGIELPGVILSTTSLLVCVAGFVLGREPFKSLKQRTRNSKESVTGRGI